MYSLKVNSPFDETAVEFLLEIHNVFLKSFSFLHLAALDVVINVLVIDLVDSESAEIVLGLRNDRVVVILIDLPQPIGLEFGLIDRVLVLFVEDEVQNLLGLDFSLHISPPDISGCDFEFFIIGADLRDDHQLLKGIVEMLLVVVERGVLDFLCLFLLAGLYGPLELINIAYFGDREAMVTVGT
jgi:hypothetical protein